MSAILFSEHTTLTKQETRKLVAEVVVTNYNYERHFYITSVHVVAPTLSSSCSNGYKLTTRQLDWVLTGEDFSSFGTLALH